MKTQPLACNLSAMTPGQRRHYGAIKTRLRSVVQEVKGLPNGYAFRYDASPELIVTAAEFITLESRSRLLRLRQIQPDYLAASVGANTGDTSV